MTPDQWYTVALAVIGLLTAIVGVLHSRGTRSKVSELEVWTGKQPSKNDRETPQR